ncbi:hypothetical protein PENSUB_1340 [Penicillium subrubescens]|uniref:Uncharacterized protein n=1 Tax=Penicillium subrubescens TaxID=1316194 RepID=A0A1Q5UKE5_9EURO|nr:hypothetical protein PENSUB_1340 [Penicillium subrubescens]
MPAGELRRTINELTKIQRRAAILISGAFKSTSAKSAIRIQTGAAWAQLKCLRRQHSLQETRKGGWSPLGALRWKKDGIMGQQGTWESRKAFVLAPWEARILCVIEDAEVARASYDKIETESLFQQALSNDRP